MKAKWLKIGLPLLFAAAAAAATIFLRARNDRMRERIVGLGQSRAGTSSLRENNQKLRLLIERAKAGDAVEREIRAEVLEARNQVAELEKRAEQRHAQLLAQAEGDAAALAHNRDPQIGLARLEHFRNIGQATPAATCQTLVWAVMKDDREALANLFVLDDAGHAQAEQMRAGLPEDVRARWTPEELGALYFTAVMTDVPAAQIVSETFVEPQRARVQLRIPGLPPDKSAVELQSTAAGWRVILTAQHLHVLRRRLAAADKK